MASNGDHNLGHWHLSPHRGDPSKRGHRPFWPTWLCSPTPHTLMSSLGIGKTSRTLWPGRSYPPSSNLASWPRTTVSSLATPSTMPSCTTHWQEQLPSQQNGQSPGDHTHSSSFSLTLKQPPSSTGKCRTIPHCPRCQTSIFDPGQPTRRRHTWLSYGNPPNGASQAWADWLSKTEQYLLQEHPWAAQGRGYHLEAVTKPLMPHPKGHTWRKGRPAFWEQLKAVLQLALQQPTTSQAGPVQGFMSRIRHAHRHWVGAPTWAQFLDTCHHWHRYRDPHAAELMLQTIGPRNTASCQ